MRFSSYLLLFLLPVLALCFTGCSVSEEVRQIERGKLAQQEELAGRQEELTGQQVFIRSCNTCHPGGKAGLGPALDNIDRHFPTDAQLSKFIRTGSGQMPPQPQSVLTDKELSNLIAYLRSTCAARTEATPESQSSQSSTRR